MDFPVNSEQYLKILLDGKIVDVYIGDLTQEQQDMLRKALKRPGKPSLEQKSPQKVYLTQSSPSKRAGGRKGFACKQPERRCSWSGDCPLVGNAFEDNFEEFFLHMRGVKCDCSSKGKAGGAKHTLGCLFAKSACETCGMTQMQSEKVQMNEFKTAAMFEKYLKPILERLEVHIPDMVLSKFCGYTDLIMPKFKDLGDPVLGSRDAGKTFSYDEKVSKVAQHVLKQINLGEMVFVHNGKTFMIALPIDTEGYTTPNETKILWLDIARVPPPAVVASGSEDLYKTLRFEYFVLHEGAPLHCESGRIKCSDGIFDADVIKKVRADLETRIPEEIAMHLKTVGEKISPREFVWILHSYGFNLRDMRYLIAAMENRQCPDWQIKLAKETVYLHSYAKGLWDFMAQKYRENTSKSHEDKVEYVLNCLDCDTRLRAVEMLASEYCKSNFGLDFVMPGDNDETRMFLEQHTGIIFDRGEVAGIQRIAIHLQDICSFHPESREEVKQALDFFPADIATLEAYQNLMGKSQVIDILMERAILIKERLDKLAVHEVEALYEGCDYHSSAELAEQIRQPEAMKYLGKSLFFTSDDMENVKHILHDAHRDDPDDSSVCEFLAVCHMRDRDQDAFVDYMMKALAGRRTQFTVGNVQKILIHSGRSDHIDEPNVILDDQSDDEDEGMR